MSAYAYVITVVNVALIFWGGFQVGRIFGYRKAHRDVQHRITTGRWPT